MEINVTRFAVAAISVAASFLPAFGQARPMSLEGAKWIWARCEGEPPAGPCFLRGSLTLPEAAQIKSAEVALSVDNLYSVYVNGRYVGQSEMDPDKWSQAKRFDVTAMVTPGRNVVAVEGVNTAPGPAGLILKLVVQLADGQEAVLVSDAAWWCWEEERPSWQQVGFDDKGWRTVQVVATYGDAPWHKFAENLAKTPVLKAGEGAKAPLTWRKLSAGVRGLAEVKPPPDFRWPDAIVFLGGDCSLYLPKQGTGTSHDSLGVTLFTTRKSRAFPEHDLPAPLKMGRKLFALKPAQPDGKPKLLLDAGKGAIGSPTVSFDGKSIYVSMAYDGEPFFHIYRLPAEGGQPKRLTDGPYHDIDPAELPDGRIAFTSTRSGTFEEYHNSPSRGLFSMNAEGGDIQVITSTFVFDNEPEVMPDGRILFIRSDNFFGRGKVETLLHAVHPDGSEGYTEFGLDQGPEYGGRLRPFYCGSPAPMPDGRVAFVSGPGITLGWPATPMNQWRNFPMQAGDVAALPDNRLLCTVGKMVAYQVPGKDGPRTAYELSYEKIAVLDPQTNELVVLHESQDGALHSPVFLGPRQRPPVLAKKVTRQDADDVRATGVLFCHSVGATKNTTAGWPHVRAIRVLGSNGLTMRSSHAYIVHSGSEVVDLGTVPLAPDGSFLVEVPADMGIAFQAVDAEGRSELNEMSWIFVRPGERRSCMGCHNVRQAMPPAGAPQAMATRTEPLKLLGQGRPHRWRGNNAAVTGMMEVQADRFREVASINRHSETADPLATSAQEVAELVALLKGGDEGQRISAAQRLAIFRDPAAAAGLAERLADTSREARTAATLALAACGTRESVGPLLGVLADPDPLVAQAASVALENLTGHAELFNAFAPHDLRVAQADKWKTWCRDTGWPEIEQDLIRRLEDSNRDVVRRAAVTLGHVGGPAAAAALRAYVERQRVNNPYPEWLKGHSGDGAMYNSASPANPRTLQAATRSLGYLKDAAAVPMLLDTIARNSDPQKSNLFLTEAACEALGRIGTQEAQEALVKALAGLQDYFFYVGWYGDHSALYACHASPPHYFIAEGLDATACRQAGGVLANLIRSVPTDPDRALLPYNDDCETLVGRVIRRNDPDATVIETCLAILGDKEAKKAPPIAQAIGTTYAAWAGRPDPENRAAHILSLACRHRKYEPRIRAALDRYRDRPLEKDLKRAFGGGGLPGRIPVKHWVCFFLARELGNLADPASVDSLLAVVEQCPTEASLGYPDPADPAVLFLHNDLTPCYRAEAAWALGRIADRRATPAMLKVVADLQNAPDTRHAAAVALQRLAAPTDLDALRKLAAACPDVATRRALLLACDKLKP
jgi:HEAT repeat protein